MNKELMALLNGVELQNELNVFAKKVLDGRGIKENADDVAKFIIECITARAMDGRLKMVGISDATMTNIVVKSIGYLPAWRKEKAQKKKAKDPKPETKTDPKTTRTSKPKAEKKADFDLNQIKVGETAKKFVQMEIEFDI